MSEPVLTSSAVSTAAHSAVNSEILTVLEVALFLRVPKSTVYKLARLGVLPASKIGKHWRFLRRDIQGWMQRGSHHAV